MDDRYASVVSFGPHQRVGHTLAVMAQQFMSREFDPLVDLIRETDPLVVAFICLQLPGFGSMPRVVQLQDYLARKIEEDANGRPAAAG